MSGIAGIHADARPDPESLRAAVRRLRHRGDAHEAIHADGAVAFAVTQSAREVAPGAHPLHSADRRFTLIADGYCAGSDALRAACPAGRGGIDGHGWARVLEAWPTLAEGLPERRLEPFAGAFAFAVHDRDSGRLVLGRDRRGARPLYLARTMYGWAFASEPSALLALTGPPAIDPAALAAWLEGGFIAGRRTLMAGIERVLPGELVVIDPDADPVRMAPPPLHPAEPGRGAGDAGERLDAALRAALEDPFSGAGPDAALLLTHDVGSALLLAALAGADRLPARTFSIGRIDDAGDSGAAAALARHFGVEHEVIPVGRDDLVDRLALAAWASDDAGGEAGAAALLALGAALGADAGPVLTTAGAAEAFAAAPRFRVHRMSRWMDALLEPGTGGFRTRAEFRGLERSLFRPALQRAAAEWREPLIAAWGDTPSEWTALRRMQHLDLTEWLPATVLPGIDRALAATGHDWRAPWLDPRVVGLGLALPDAVKRGGRRSDGFLDTYARDRVLHVLQGTPRTAPHPPPLGPWLSGATLDRIERILPASPAIRAWFAPDAVATLVRMRRDGRPAARRLLALLRFALWHRVFIEGEGDCPAVGDPLAFLEASDGTSGE